MSRCKPVQGPAIFRPRLDRGERLAVRALLPPISNRQVRVAVRADLDRRLQAVAACQPDVARALWVCAASSVGATLCVLGLAGLAAVGVRGAAAVQALPEVQRQVMSSAATGLLGAPAAVLGACAVGLCCVSVLSVCAAAATPVAAWFFPPEDPGVSSRETDDLAD